MEQEHSLPQCWWWGWSCQDFAHMSFVKSPGKEDTVTALLPLCSAGGLKHRTNSSHLWYSCCFTPQTFLPVLLILFLLQLIFAAALWVLRESALILTFSPSAGEVVCKCQKHHHIPKAPTLQITPHGPSQSCFYLKYIQHVWSLTALLEGHYFFSRSSIRESHAKTDSAATLLRYKITRIRKLYCCPRQGSKDTRRWCFLTSGRVCCLGAGFMETVSRVWIEPVLALGLTQSPEPHWAMPFGLGRVLLWALHGKESQVSAEGKQEMGVWLGEPTLHMFIPEHSHKNFLFLLNTSHGLLWILSNCLGTGNKSCFIMKASIVGVFFFDYFSACCI